MDKNYKNFRIIKVKVLNKITEQLKNYLLKIIKKIMKILINNYQIKKMGIFKKIFYQVIMKINYV